MLRNVFLLPYVTLTNLHHQYQQHKNKCCNLSYDTVVGNVFDAHELTCSFTMMKLEKALSIHVVSMTIKDLPL